MSSYDFDPQKEAATVKIRVLPNRYVAIRELQDGVYKRRLLFPRREQEIQPDGKAKVVYNNDGADMWVPPRIANQLAIKEADVKDVGWTPIAAILESRDLKAVEKTQVVEVLDPLPAPKVPRVKRSSMQRPHEREMEKAAAAEAAV